MADALPCPVRGCPEPICEPNLLWTCDDHHPYVDELRIRAWVIGLQQRLADLAETLGAKNAHQQRMEREIRDFEAAQQALLDQGIWVEKVPIHETIADPLGGYRFLVRRDRPDRDIDPTSCPGGCGHPIRQHTTLDGCLYSNDDMRGYCPCEVRP
jgi:hypothetical protein